MGRDGPRDGNRQLSHTPPCTRAIRHPEQIVNIDRYKTTCGRGAWNPAPPQVGTDALRRFTDLQFRKSAAFGVAELAATPGPFSGIG